MPDSIITYEQVDSALALVMIAILPFLFVSIYFISRKGVPMYTKVQHSVVPSTTS